MPGEGIAESFFDRRFGCPVWSAFSRPVVRPSAVQLAAR